MLKYDVDKELIGKEINYFHRTGFKVEEIKDGEDIERKRIREMLEISYGREVVEQIMVILYSAGIEKLYGKYVRVEFKHGIIDSVEIVESPEEKEDVITFKVKKEGLREEIEKKVYEAIESMRLSLDKNYWKAYRDTPDIVLNAYLGRVLGLGV